MSDRRAALEIVIDQAARWGYDQARMQLALRDELKFDPPVIVWSEDGKPIITNWRCA